MHDWSLFADAKSPSPRPQSSDLLDWLCRRCGQPEIVRVLNLDAVSLKAQKLTLPMFGGFRLAGSRADRHVLGRGYIELDFDDLPAASEADLDDALAGIRHVAYTTISHGVLGKGVRLRYVLALDREILPAEWPQVRAGILALFPAADANALKLSQGAFAPAHLDGQEFYWGASADDAVPMPVDALLSAAPEASVAERQREPETGDIPSSILDRVIGKLRRSNRQFDVRVGEHLRLAVEGLAFERSEGRRNRAAFDVVGALCKGIPDISEQQVVDTLIQACEAQGSPTEDKLADMARRWIDRLAGEGVPTGELETVNQTGAAVYLLRHANSKTVYCALTPGSYSPCTLDVVPQVVSDAMGWAGLGLLKETPTGVRPKTPSELVHDYGRSIHEICHDHTIDTPVVGLDRAEGVLSLPVRRAEIEPRYNQSVQGWLDLLDPTGRLSRWIAACPDATRTLPMLYLIGDAGIGKTLLADGLGAIWPRREGLANAMGSFNTAILSTLLLYSDEGLPRTLSGKIDTQQIRSLPTAFEHQVNQKNQALVTVRGYPRVIIGANNDVDLRALGRQATEGDLYAIAQRFLIIDRRHDPRAAQYLEMRREEIRSVWVTGGIAEHALWLAANLDPALEGRFGFGEQTPPVATFSGGYGGLLLQWAAKALLAGPAQVEGLWLSDDHVHTTARDVERSWSQMVDKRLDGSVISRTMQLFPADDAGVTAIPLGLLRQWCRDSRYVSVQDFDIALARHRADRGEGDVLDLDRYREIG